MASVAILLYDVCNCPRSRPLFREKLDETCCHSVVAPKWLKTQSVGSAELKYYNFNTNTDHYELGTQRLNSNELEEQCIHHFNLIKYLIEGNVRLTRER